MSATVNCPCAIISLKRVGFTMSLEADEADEAEQIGEPMEKCPYFARHIVKACCQEVSWTSGEACCPPDTCRSSRRQHTDQRSQDLSHSPEEREGGASGRASGSPVALQRTSLFGQREQFW